MWAGRRKLPCPGAPRGVRHPPMEKRSRKRLGPTASTRAFSAVWAFRGRCSWSANIRETCCTLCHIPRPRCLCVALRCCRRSCSYPCDAYSNLSRLCGMHLACQVRSLRGVPRPLRPTAQKCSSPCAAEAHRRWSALRLSWASPFPGVVVGPYSGCTDIERSVALMLIARRCGGDAAHRGGAWFRTSAVFARQRIDAHARPCVEKRMRGQLP